MSREETGRNARALREAAARGEPLSLGAQSELLDLLEAVADADAAWGEELNGMSKSAWLDLHHDVVNQARETFEYKEPLPK